MRSKPAFGLNAALMFMFAAACVKGMSCELS
jgi:hypothetical protein